MEELVESDVIEALFVSGGYLELLARFAFNMLIVWSVIHFFYYPKSKRVDYYFTFTLISVSIFLMIFLLGGVKLKVGFALGLFAIFGIIRYRTESMPVREMTYLFVIIAISVINALAVEVGIIELVCTNLLFVLSVFLCERLHKGKRTSTKLVLYDRVELISPEHRADLIEDLKKRTGLEVVRVEVGHIDFLRDTAMLRVHYVADDDQHNSVDKLIKFPKEETL